MAEFTATLACQAGCLDQLADTLGAAGARVESVACLSREGGEGVVTFSLAEPQRVTEESFRQVNATETGVSVLQVKVPNAAGCLSNVTTSLSKAGVTISSLACACAAGDESGVVAVGLAPQR